MSEPLTLVLGGGGLFGAYQAGLWLALEGNVALDGVIGASIGAVNGWAIASGVPAREWIDRWLHAGPWARMEWRWPLRRSGALLNAAPYERFLRELCETHTPRVRYGCAVTELPRLNKKLITYPEAGWRHLAASCAMPFLFPPVKLADKWCIDGGLFAACPMWAVTDAEPRRVLAVDCWNDGPWEESAGTLLVRPRRSLGSWTEMLAFDADRTARWIEAGREDGLEVLRRFRPS